MYENERTKSGRSSSRGAGDAERSPQSGPGDEVRDLVMEILGAIRVGRTHATTVIAEIFREEKVPPQRRGVLAEQVYAILRSERLLDFVLDASTKTPLEDRARDKGRRLARAVLDGALTPAEAEYEMRRVDWNEVLKARQRAMKEPDPVKRLAISTSLPDWLAERMLEQLHDQAEPLARALGEPPPQTIRVNRMRIERSALTERLSAARVSVEGTSLASDGLRIVPKTNLFRLAEFREGLFEVQDEGSQLVSELVAPPPGGSVLDACAGTGGKTLHLGAILRGKGSITAVGVGSSAVGQIQELRRRADRAGLNNVRTVLLPDVPNAAMHSAGVDTFDSEDVIESLLSTDAGEGSSWSDDRGARSDTRGPDRDASRRSIGAETEQRDEERAVERDAIEGVENHDVHVENRGHDQLARTVSPFRGEAQPSAAGFPAPLQKLIGRVDRVLVDAPCSGVGVLRRNPDARTRIDPAAIERLAGLQRSILERFAPFVKVGGRLIYSTCSFLREENEDVVAGFLTAHPDFVLMSAKEILGAKRALSMGDGDVLRVFPHQQGTDAFFGAVLRRTNTKVTSPEDAPPDA